MFAVRYCPRTWLHGRWGSGTIRAHLFTCPVSSCDIGVSMKCVEFRPSQTMHRQCPQPRVWIQLTVTKAGQLFTTIRWAFTHLLHDVAIKIITKDADDAYNIAVALLTLTSCI